MIDEEDQITPEEAAKVMDGEIIDEINENGSLEDLREQLQKAKNEDIESYLAGKTNAKITKKINDLSEEQLDQWLMEIEAYKASKIG